MPGRIRIGISGWTYPPWRGVFYPEKLAQKRELEYAASRFASIEVNGTFYGLQRPDSFAHWAEQTPDDFVFAIKGSRYISHIRRAKNVEVPLANFLASGLLRLGSKLGPLLWQFPPSFKFDPETFEAFLAMLPHTPADAVKLARRHEPRLDGRVWLRAKGVRRLRHAVEIRHDSFRDPAFIAMLRRHKVALVCADTVEWPRLMDLTTDFVYCRLHGSEELYASGYGDAALDDWARRVAAWAAGGEPEDAERVGKAARERKSGRDVFVYFDNDAKVRAPADARGLAERLGVAVPVRESRP
jgi:uncharacterized protein YecE (DUF72 family)